MRPLVVALSFALLLAGILGAFLSGTGPARAEEDADELVRRFFQVGSLTIGQLDYIKGRMGVVSPDMVSDEENPLFGAEGEEPILPVGSVDELIELIKRNVDPVYWEITEGADVQAFGEGTLYVQAGRRVLAEIAGYLSHLETEVLTSVTIEVRTVRGPVPATAWLPDEAVQALEAGPSVFLTAMVGQQATCFAGRQVSFVQDYDVEVAKSATISDPIVSVANYGLAVAARALLGDDPERLRVQIDAHVVRHQGFREHTTWGGKNEAGRTIELPTDEEAAAWADLLVMPGTWYVASGDAGGDTKADWYFLVRVMPRRPKAPALGLPVVFGRSPPADSGPLATRTFNVMDMMDVVPNRMGESINLVPSNFTPPEPPELPEPAPIFPWEAFYEVIPQLVMPKSWNRQGAGIEVRMGRLMVTNTERALDAVAATLRNLRREFLWTVRTRAEVLLVDEKVARSLLTPGAEGHLLDGRGRKMLDAALGSAGAERAALLEVVCPADARNAAAAGRRRSYLQDYEVEIAEDAVIANPVVQEFRTGSVLDLRPAITSTGDAVNLALRFTHGRLTEPMRTVDSPHGSIDAPELALFRLRTNLRIPLERTALVGAGTFQGRAVLLLLTPTVHRYGR